MIPEAMPESPEVRAVKSPRTWERGRACIPQKLPDDFDKTKFSTVQRYLFYGYDTLVMNISDPSHIDLAHHKVRI